MITENEKMHKKIRLLQEKVPASAPIFLIFQRKSGIIFVEKFV